MFFFLILELAKATEGIPMISVPLQPQIEVEMDGYTGNILAVTSIMREPMQIFMERKVEVSADKANCAKRAPGAGPLRPERHHPK
jgi:hypothetical protein